MDHLRDGAGAGYHCALRRKKATLGTHARSSECRHDLERSRDRRSTWVWPWPQALDQNSRCFDLVEACGRRAGLVAIARQKNATEGDSDESDESQSRTGSDAEAGPSKAQPGPDLGADDQAHPAFAQASDNKQATLRCLITARLASRRRLAQMALSRRASPRRTADACFLSLQDLPMETHEDSMTVTAMLPYSRATIDRAPETHYFHSCPLRALPQL